MEDREDGFTPVFDDVVRQVGLSGAAVFGCVWRHCQMRHGNCHASMETMGTLLGLSKRTIQKQLDMLEKAKLIVKQERERWYKPPVYVCTYEPVVKRVAEIAML